MLNNCLTSQGKLGLIRGGLSTQDPVPRKEFLQRSRTIWENLGAPGANSALPPLASLQLLTWAQGSVTILFLHALSVAPDGLCGTVAMPESFSRADQIRGVEAGLGAGGPGGPVAPEQSRFCRGQEREGRGSCWVGGWVGAGTKTVELRGQKKRSDNCLSETVSRSGFRCGGPARVERGCELQVPLHETGAPAPPRVLALVCPLRTAPAPAVVAETPACRVYRRGFPAVAFLSGLTDDTRSHPG